APCGPPGGGVGASGPGGPTGGGHPLDARAWGDPGGAGGRGGGGLAQPPRGAPGPDGGKLALSRPGGGGARPAGELPALGTAPAGLRLAGHPAGWGADACGVDRHPGGGGGPGGPAGHLAAGPVQRRPGAAGGGGPGAFGLPDLHPGGGQPDGDRRRPAPGGPAAGGPRSGPWGAGRRGRRRGAAGEDGQSGDRSGFGGDPAGRGFQVAMTRSDDTFIPLWERAALANALNADLFVSIHNNSASDPAARGTETYYLPKQPNNLWLAQAVQQELVRTLGRRDRGVKSNNFWVLRDAEVPAILVEVSFLSNPEERALLADPEYRRKAAEAIARGIIQYFARLASGPAQALNQADSAELWQRVMGEPRTESGAQNPR